MSKQTLHPTTEQLDQLRAELLDDNLDATKKLEQHIHDCTQCQQRLSDWTRLGEIMAPSDQDLSDIDTALRSARKTAIAAKAASKTCYLQPAFAMAASVLLMVTLGVWQPWTSLNPSPDQVAQGQTATNPEIFDDVDFYLWLAGHEESNRAAGNTLAAKA